MSLVKTLTRVAIGVAVAKGVSTMSKRGGAQSGGSVFGGAGTGTRMDTGSAGGNIGDMLGQVLSGRGASAGGAAGGLGGLLEGLSQTSRGGMAPSQVDRPSSGSLGDLLNQSFEKFGEPEVAPTPQHEETAGVLLRCMLQAAKCDGRIDGDEKAKLMENLGDISPAEMQFVNDELAKPVDVAGLARDVPQGAEQQAYMMSVMAIDLDSQGEAKYLHELAQALGIQPAQSNAVHEHLGVPPIYR